MGVCLMQGPGGWGGARAGSRARLLSPRSKAATHWGQGHQSPAKSPWPFIIMKKHLCSEDACVARSGPSTAPFLTHVDNEGCGAWTWLRD